ncbi:MAG: 2-C-methyl-D-erythritol 4-phosphate cytidylyltransferase [Sporolactobacillus sp.]
MYQAIVVAAGRGSRMGGAQNKVLLPLCGVPLIVHTLRVFEQAAECLGIVLVTKEQEIPIFRRLVEAEQLTKVYALTSGGAERQQSVAHGLQHVTGPADQVVLIHDGARPFVTAGEAAAVTERATVVGAAVLAVPVKDTIKMVEEGLVKHTLSRESLWAIQTPQAFRLSVIRAAHRQGAEQHVTVTDDAALVEHAGWQVAVVEGSYRNIKLTTPEDWLVAEQMLKKEGKRL